MSVLPVIRKEYDREEKLTLCKSVEKKPELSIALAVSFPCEDYDTFNGLVFHVLDSVPEVSLRSLWLAINSVIYLYVDTINKSVFMISS